MKNIINCIVVDDEPLAIEQMEDFIGRIDFLKLKASFDNAFDAMNFIKTKSTDIVFLDIEMDDFTGIQLLESLDKIPYVILTTAYDKYALEALSDALRNELKSAGIWVSLIEPGIIRTKFREKAQRYFIPIKENRTSYHYESYQKIFQDRQKELARRIPSSEAVVKRIIHLPRQAISKRLLWGIPGEKPDSFA